MSFKKNISTGLSSMVAIPSAIVFTAVELPFKIAFNILKLDLVNAILSPLQSVYEAVSRSNNWTNNLSELLAPKTITKDNGGKVLKRVFKTGVIHKNKITLYSKNRNFLVQTKKDYFSNRIFPSIDGKVENSGIIKTTKHSEGEFKMDNTKQDFIFDRHYDRSGKYVGSEVSVKDSSDFVKPRKVLTGQEKNDFIAKLNGFKGKNTERDLSENAKQKNKIDIYN